MSAIATIKKSAITLLFSAMLLTAAESKADSCDDSSSWVVPKIPSTTHPDYGAYVKTLAYYSDKCNGHATKNADTDDWEDYPTKVSSDGYFAEVKHTTNAGELVQSGGLSSLGGNTGSASAVQKGSQGSITNANYLQDTLTCSGSGSFEVTICGGYQTTASGTVYLGFYDGFSQLQITKTTGGSYSWTDGNGQIRSKKSDGSINSDECNTATLTVNGSNINFFFSMYFYSKGTKFKQNGSTLWERDGNMHSSFSAGSLTGSGVTCSSSSGTFPGVDGKTTEEYAKQKEGDELCGGSFAQNQSGLPGAAGNGTGNGLIFGRNNPTGTISVSSDFGAPIHFIGNPINFVRGFKVQKEVDYAGDMGLNLVRTYRSNGDWLDYNFGTYWRHNFDRKLSIDTSVGTNSDTFATITNENGVVTEYKEVSANTWEPVDFDITATFESILSGSTVVGYKYNRQDNVIEIYNTSGLLTRIEYNGHYALDLSYDGSNRLDEVEDKSGRTITFNYDTSDRVSSIVTPDGTYSYSYDSNNNLTQVTKPDTETRQYHYEDTTYVNALTGITNEDSVRIATWDYDTEGRPVSYESASGVNEFTVTYNSDDTVTVTNPLGKQTTFTYETINNVRKITNVEGHASTSCPASARSYQYNAKGWIVQMTDWEDNETTYEYDDNGLQTSRTEAVGEQEERTITTTWDSTFRLPNVITRTGRTTDYNYDSYGRLTSVTLTDTNTSEARTWTYTYYSNSTDGAGNTILGRLQTVNGPRTDVTDTTTYAYDTNFNLTTITNALSQVTEVTARDSAGRPTTVEDENNVEVDLTYDTNGRLENATAAPGTSLEAVTTFTYSDAGDITEIEQPNGTTLTYSYDNARRLTGIEDDLGNTITYTLDDAGNVTKEERKDSGLALKYFYNQTFDELSRIIKLTGTDSQEWEYGYDKNSNLTDYTDANNNATSYAFDGLERLVESTDALSGVTGLTYNDLDQLEEVEDPRTNTTEYTYNAFGDVTQIDSPDTGTTTFTHDKNGNITSMTDARSVVTNYTYDAINRLTDIAYPSDSSLDVDLTYDDNPDTTGACGTSIGRLCRVDDAAGTTDYKYNDLGQLIEVKEVHGALTFTTAYEYDLSGLLEKITLPSGREVTYTRNANGQVTGVAAQVNFTTTTLSSSMAYLPFGPMSGMTYGNSLTLSNTYDQDYLLTARSVNTVYSHTYDHDPNGNVTQKGSWTYDYDALNRLDEQNDGSTTTAYTYDAIGNRLTENDGSTTSYTYPSTSSKLSSVGSDSYTYDAAGNITDNDTYKFTWNAAGQLEEVKDSSTSTSIATYVYDASNLRTSKTVSGTTTYYVHGLGGVLLGEYDSSGNFIREYVYVNNEPLAQVDAGSPEVLTYLHTDHLMTPRYGTNTSASTVWSWDSGGFGAEVPTGTQTINLRFPGQYYDTETGLHYNWNRYYDPTTGRYISSDPIGLAGGLNTFAYSLNNPMLNIDPRGNDSEWFKEWKRRTQANIHLKDTAREWKNKEIVGSDLFFHCLAACRATKASGDSEYVLWVMKTKEYTDIVRWKLGGYKPGIGTDTEMAEDTAKDLEANTFGASCLADTSCVDHCHYILDAKMDDYPKSRDLLREIYPKSTPSKTFPGNDNIKDEKPNIRL